MEFQATLAYDKEGTSISGGIIAAASEVDQKDTIFLYSFLRRISLLFTYTGTVITLGDSAFPRA